LVPSYGQVAIQNEIAKWTMFQGLPIIVHNADWSVSGSSVITGIGNLDSTALSIAPPLGFTPTSGYIVDIARYPSSTDRNEDALYKLLYAHIAPTVPVVTGFSDTVFQVPLTGANVMTVGNTVFVRNGSYSIYSDEEKVIAISGDIITTTNLGFTPASGYFVEGIGFKDGQSFYRYG
jgi:hypothetical protein